MSECCIGMFAKSKAGHDKEKVYVIKDADRAYVYLVDGRLRPLDHPKKKKWKHIQIIREQCDPGKMDDIEIRRMLKKWNYESSKEEVKQED